MLLVEDYENDALLLLRELERGGYDPISERVETPREMRRALATSRWDVIISDYRLPNFGALEALELASVSGSRAPFIVVSGQVGEDVAVETMKAGAHDYVMKDNLARLCATVERGIEETKDRRRAEEELLRRDAILEAVRFAAERLFGEEISWERSVRDILQRLGEATEASRVYVFENHTDENGEIWGSQRYEWAAPGVAAQMDNPLM